MSTNTAKPTKGQVIKVSRADLPLSCPRPEDEVWKIMVYYDILKQKRFEYETAGLHSDRLFFP